MFKNHPTRVVFQPHHSNLRPVGKSTMTRIQLLLLPIAALLAIGSSAGASDRDAKYANGLVERGYFDLAEIEYTRMSKDTSAGADRQRAGRLGLARVKRQASLRENDPKVKLAKYAEAEKEFGEFIQDRQDPMYFLAAFELGSLLQDKATAIATIIEEDLVSRTGFESPEAIREEAAESLNEAQTLFDDLVGYLETQRNLNITQQSNLERSRYLSATNYYYLGLLFPRGTFERESNFKRATEKLEDFIWEYESRPSALYALLFKGKSHFEMSLENKSESDLNEALDSFAGLEGIGDAPDSLAILHETFERATLEAASALNEWQKYADANVKVDSMLEAFKTNGPQIRMGQRGHLAVLEKAKGLHKMGDVDLALTWARKVAEEVKGSVAGRYANDLIKEILGGSDGGDVQDPKILMAGGEAYYSSREYGQASYSYRQAITAFEIQEEASRDNELAAQAWNRLGDCLKRVGRNFESGLAFSAGRDRYQEPFDLYKDNSFRAYSSFQAFAKKAPDSGKAAAVAYSDQAKNFILSTFKEDVGDIIYFEAKDDFDENKFTLAKDKFFRVDIQTRHYETAQLYIARCDMEAGYTAIEKDGGNLSASSRQSINDGIKTLHGYREWTKTYPAPDPARAAARSQALAASEYYESEAYWTLKDYDKMLRVLEGFDTRWAEHPSLIPPSLYNRIRAYLAKEDMESASQWAHHIFKVYPKSGSTVQALALIGQAYAAQEDKAEEAGDEAAAAINRKKSADFLYQWLQASGARFSQAVTVGNKFYTLKDYGTAIKIFKSTYDRYKNNSKYKGTKSLFNLKLAMARSYLAVQKYHEAEPLFEEMLKSHGETLDLLIGVAKCHGGWIEEVDGKFVEFDGTARFEDALKIYSRFVGTTEPASDTWWLGKFGQVYILYKAGNQDSAKKRMKNLVILYEQPFGPTEVDKRVKWLKRVLGE